MATMTELRRCLRVPDELYFYGPEVARLAGVSISALNYWERTGLVWPSVSRPRRGEGLRQWSLLDVLVVRCIRALRNCGLSLQAIRLALARLSKAGVHRALHQALDPLTPVVLVLQGDDIQVLDDDGAWSVLRHPGQRVLILNRVALPCSEEAIRLFASKTEVLVRINEPTYKERLEGATVTEEVIGYTRQIPD